MPPCRSKLGCTRVSERAFFFALGISQKPIQLEWDFVKEGDSARLPLSFHLLIPPQLRNVNSQSRSGRRPWRRWLARRRAGRPRHRSYKTATVTFIQFHDSCNSVIWAVSKAIQSPAKLFLLDHSSPDGAPLCHVSFQFPSLSL